MTNFPPDDRIAWHALPLAELYQRLDTRAAGLSRAEADQRRQRYGLNRLQPPRRRSALRRLLDQFANVLIYLLLAAAAVTAALGHGLDTAVILGVVVINALIGFLQEHRAEQALLAIRELLAPQALVSRDGQRQSLAAEQLVPGDVVWLQSGDRVPADLRLIAARNLQLQEATLTGEALPVTKDPAPVAVAAELADRQSMAYAGTLVAAGQGQGVVVATAAATELGRISTLLAEVETLATPLLRQLGVFSRRLSVIIMAIAGLTFAFGWGLRGYPLDELFLAVVGLAVAAIPEGLPAIMTITLAIGVQRMARRRAIVRQLPAVEALGSVSVICTDKTGTLTRNEMAVRSVAVADGLITVDGTGYDPAGELRLDGATVSLSARPVLAELVCAGLLCNDATLQHDDDGWRVAGDPTEGALLTLALKAGLEPDRERQDQPRLDVLPFESEHRFMASLHRRADGAGMIYVKGAPERVLAMCDRQRGADGDRALERAYWQAVMDQLAAQGQRVLALAQRPVPTSQTRLTPADVASGLSLLGLVGQADPPRPEAIAAVQQCRAAGIRVKMITGDHAGTARAIAGELGLDTAAGVLTGRELDAFDDAALCRQAARVDVFARTSPAHKLRLVEALQAAGSSVAMTGDGVNDAPALKRADVGIAMGGRGTEAAKEAAEIVLADDNFATIAHAVEEGRTVYDNLRKAILFILPTSIGEAMVVVLAILFDLQLPISPVQILWINMITTVTLALALAFEPAERNVMARPPRPPAAPLLSGLLVWRTVLVSLLQVAAVFGLFLWHVHQGMALELSRTVSVNALVLCEAIYLFNTRRLSDPVLNADGLLGSRPVLIAVLAVLVLQLAFTYLPPFQELFASRPLDGSDWLILALVAGAVLLLVELEKWLLRRRRLAGRRAMSIH